MAGEWKITINDLINKLEAVHLDTTDSPQMEKPSTSKNLDHSGTVAKTQREKGHFGTQLHSELQQIREMCRIWKQISTQYVLSREKQELALAAVREVNLVMTQNLQQLAVLLRRMEQSQPGKALVTEEVWNILYPYENQDQNSDHGLGASTSNDVELEDVTVNKTVNPKAKDKTKKKLRRQNAIDKI